VFVVALPQVWFFFIVVFDLDDGVVGGGVVGVFYFNDVGLVFALFVLWLGHFLRQNQGVWCKSCIQSSCGRVVCTWCLSTEVYTGRFIGTKFCEGRTAANSQS